MDVSIGARVHQIYARLAETGLKLHPNDLSQPTAPACKTTTGTHRTGARGIPVEMNLAAEGHETSSQAYQAEYISPKMFRAQAIHVDTVDPST